MLLITRVNMNTFPASLLPKLPNNQIFVLSICMDITQHNFIPFQIKMQLCSGFDTSGLIVCVERGEAGGRATSGKQWGKEAN